MIKRAPVIHFVVPGKPASKGSSRLGVSKSGKPFMQPSCSREPAWRREVARAAKAAMIKAQQSDLLEGGVCVTIVCHLERPKTVSRPMPSVKPDVDKIARSVLDALTMIVYTDDCQVTDLRIKKRYGFPAETEITVMEDA